MGRTREYTTAQKTEFSINNLNVSNLQFPMDLVTFTEEILNGKRHYGL